MNIGLEPNKEEVFNITGQSALDSLIRWAKILLVGESTLMDQLDLEKLERTAYIGFELEQVHQDAYHLAEETWRTL